ncbi:hypothetical protein [Peptoclostridium acidaminophilum]|uniref:hypothetical protein n=1 Tax=Peptoclostridium acidaminophilum TaxID=1731 RepID=UPI0004BB9CAE|nr:hypothetical protein [Peptoclostridium acidaminophilum]
MKRIKTTAILMFFLVISSLLAACAKGAEVEQQPIAVRIPADKVMLLENTI